MVSEVPRELETALMIFSDAERAELARHAITLGDRSWDAVALTLGWAAGIAKIDSDRVLPPEDHSVWTEHDLVGAMYQRDRVKSALFLLPDPLRAKVQTIVDETDERFRSFTRDDPDGRLGKAAMTDVSGRPWWWHRVPVDGPIAGFLAESWYD